LKRPLNEIIKFSVYLLWKQWPTWQKSAALGHVALTYILSVLPSLMLYTGLSGQRLAAGNLIKPVPAASDRFSLPCGWSIYMSPETWLSWKQSIKHQFLPHREHSVYPL
jgi:hypothetical protein